MVLRFTICYCLAFLAQMILLNEIRNWLLPDSNSNPASGTALCRFSEYLDICRENSSVLSEHIWHIRHRRLPFRCGWYASLKEKGIIISSYFTLVYLLGSQNKAQHGRQSWAELKKIIKLSPSLGLGLKFSFGRDSVHKSLLVLSHRESLFQAGEQIWGVGVTITL